MWLDESNNTNTYRSKLLCGRCVQKWRYVHVFIGQEWAEKGIDFLVETTGHAVTTLRLNCTLDQQMKTIFIVQAIKGKSINYFGWWYSVGRVMLFLFLNSDKWRQQWRYNKCKLLIIVCFYCASSENKQTNRRSVSFPFVATDALLPESRKQKWAKERMHIEINNNKSNKLRTINIHATGIKLVCKRLSHNYADTFIHIAHVPAIQHQANAF